MPVTRTVEVTRSHVTEIETIVRKVLQQLDGKNKVVCEQAMLWAYCHISDGVVEIPLAERGKRSQLIVNRVSQKFVETIYEVAAMPIETVDAIIAELSIKKH